MFRQIQCGIVLAIAVATVVGCGSYEFKATTQPGNKTNIAGLYVEVIPGADRIMKSDPHGRPGKYAVFCGNTIVEINEMQLSVYRKVGPGESPDIKSYGPVMAGDEILIDEQQDTVTINGEKRAPTN